MRIAPNGALGYFLGDYEGLAHAGNSFVPFFVGTNFGKRANRTDVFSVKFPKGTAMAGTVAAIEGDEDDAPGDGHVEVNAKPSSIVERLKSRRWERHLR
jgi:hypothetical protein